MAKACVVADRVYSYASDTTEEGVVGGLDGSLMKVPQLGAYVERTGDGAEMNLMLMSAVTATAPGVGEYQAFSAWRPVISASVAEDDEFVLPAFVSHRDKIDVMSLLCCVAKGGFSGRSYAKLLHRAEVRCDVASDVKDAGLSLVDAQIAYEQAVAAIEEAAGLNAVSFNAEVTSLALVNGLVARGRRATCARGVDQAVADAVSVAVVGGNYAVTAAPAVKSTNMRKISALAADMVVVADSVQRALLGASVKVVGADASVSLGRRADGVFVLHYEYDSARSYQLDALPRGVCVLPGSFGMVVPTSMLADYLRHVVAMPMIVRQPGYCYLKCLPVDNRWSAYRSLGYEPNAGLVRAVAPAASSWSNKDAVIQVVRVESSGRMVYHCSVEGNLPASVSDRDLLGASAQGGLDAEAERMFSNLLAGIPSKNMGDPAVVVPPPPPPPPKAFGFSRQRARPPLKVSGPAPAVVWDDDSDSSVAPSSSASVGGGRSIGVTAGMGVPARRVNYARTASTASVASAQPNAVLSRPVGTSRSYNAVGLLQGPSEGFSPSWVSVSDPAVREWSNRLGCGPPVGSDSLSEVFKCDRRGLPRLPLAVGVSAYLPPALCRSSGSHDLRLSPQRCPVDGWFAERGKVRSASAAKPFSTTLVPADGSTLTRFELDIVGMVSVCGVITLPPGANVLWVSAAVDVVITGPGRIIRLWSKDGAAGLGQQMMMSSLVFSAPAVKCHLPGVIADTVAGLKLISEDQGSGLVRYRKRVQFRQGAAVYFYLSDDAGDEPAYVTVERPDLAHVVAGGVAVAAAFGGKASVVLASAQVNLTFRVNAGVVSDKLTVTAVCARSSRFIDAAQRAGVKGVCDTQVSRIADI